MGLINIDIDLLRTFIAINETGSFTQAGERLFRTQSAISLQMKRLEQLVGQPVCERGKEIKLTPAGEVIRHYATQILRLNDSLLRDIAQPEAPSVIRVGTPDDYAQFILPSLVSSFSRTNHNVELQVVSDLSKNLVLMADKEELDIALVTWAPDILGANDVTKGFRWTEELSWVTAPEASASLREPVPLAVSPQGCHIRELGIGALNAAGRRWRVAVTSNQFGPLRAAILAGEAVGILPTRAIPPDLSRVGDESSLPPLPRAELAVKLSQHASIHAHRLVEFVAETLGVPWVKSF